MELKKRYKDKFFLIEFIIQMNKLYELKVYYPYLIKCLNYFLCDIETITLTQIFNTNFLNINFLYYIKS